MNDQDGLLQGVEGILDADNRWHVGVVRGLEEEIANSEAARKLSIMRMGELVCTDGIHCGEEESGTRVVEAPCPLLPEIEVPELPLAAWVEADSSKAGRWLDTYVAYAKERSPRTPETFHELAGLWCGSVVIARRLCVEVGIGPLFTNIYAFQLAPTTLYAKTLGLRVLEDVLMETTPHLIFASDFTVEALTSALSGIKPANFDDLRPADRELVKEGLKFAAQKGIVLDEGSQLLRMLGRDYMAGVKEMLLRLHDCPDLWKRETRSQGMILVRNAYLSILAATTFQGVRAYLKKEDFWGAGFWSRVIFVTPEAAPEYHFTTLEKIETPPVLIEDLVRLHHALGQPGGNSPASSKEVSLEKDVFEAWKAYDKALWDLMVANQVEGKLFGNYGRLSKEALKVAVILAALDWDGKGIPTVGKHHWARAFEISERWRVSLHRLLELIEVSSGGLLRDKILDILAVEQRWLTARDIARKLGYQAGSDVEAELKAMVRENAIVGKYGGSPKGGQRTWWYHLPQ